MKKIVAFTAAVFVLITCLPVLAVDVKDPYTLYVSGVRHSGPEPVVFADKKPFLGAATLAELLDATWRIEEDASGAVIRGEDWELAVRVSESSARLNGRAVDLGAQVFEQQGIIYIPVALLGKSLGMKTVGDPLTQSLFLYKQGGTPRDRLDDKTEEQREVLGPTRPKDPGGPVYIDGTNVVITAGAAATPRITKLMDAPPYRLVLDYASAAFAGLTSGELPGGGTVVKVRYALNNPETVRFVIELTRPADYRLEQSDGGKVTRITIVEPTQRRFKVVIDPGHGGDDPGTTGASGRYEKHFTLELSRKVANLMKQVSWLEPHMTRQDDTYPTLEERAAFANNIGADLYVSIHGNAYTGSMRGTETYYYDNTDKAFASILHRHVVQAAQTVDRNVRQADFKVLRLTKMPSALLEVGYLSDAAEEKRMLSEEFQDRVAAAIVEAVKEYLSASR